MYHAGTAQAGTATELRAGELEFLADHPQQRCLRQSFGVRRLAVDLEIYCHGSLHSMRCWVGRVGKAYGPTPGMLRDCTTRRRGAKTPSRGASSRENRELRIACGKHPETERTRPDLYAGAPRSGPHQQVMPT